MQLCTVLTVFLGEGILSSTMTFESVRHHFFVLLPVVITLVLYVSMPELNSDHFKKKIWMVLKDVWILVSPLNLRSI